MFARPTLPCTAFQHEEFSHKFHAAESFSFSDTVVGPTDQVKN